MKSEEQPTHLNWRFRFRWVIWYRITAPFRALGRFLLRVSTLYRVTFLLVTGALVLWFAFRLTLEELLPNIITDLIGVALTVFIIDTLYRVRSDNELKKILISKFGSKNSSVSSEAFHELRARGWLSDGSLNGAFLMSASHDGVSFTGADLRRVSFSFASLKDTKWFETDLTGGFLDHADLRGATFSMHAVGPHYAEADLTGVTFVFSNLAGASIRHEQLVRTRSLWRAIMPDGQIYDGRYNLPGDIDLFLKSARDPRDNQEWARFYGVLVSKYLEGQAWAAANPQYSSRPVSA